LEEGTLLDSYYVTVLCLMVWILDLGTIDHMTSFPKLFNSYVNMTRE